MNEEMKIGQMKHIELKYKLNSALLDVAGRGLCDCVLQLLSDGADEYFTDRDGNTALHIAAEKGHLKVVEGLLERNTDTLKRNHKDEIPLHLAAVSGHIEVVKKLLEKKNLAKAANLCKDLWGWTAFHYAVQEGHEDIVRFLGNLGCKVNKHENVLFSLTNDKESALHIAVKKGNSSMTNLLLELGVPKDVQDVHGNTPIIYAISKQLEDVFMLLAGGGVDLNLVNNSKASPFHHAAVQPMPCFLEVLLDLSDDPRRISEIDIHGMTPLHFVFYNRGKLLQPHQQIHNAKLLLKAGASSQINPKSSYILYSGHARKVESWLSHCVIYGEIQLLSMSLRTHSIPYSEISDVLESWKDVNLESSTIADLAEKVDLLRYYRDNPRNLLDLCRMAVRHNIIPSKRNINSLPLPKNIKAYLLYEDL